MSKHYGIQVGFTDYIGIETTRNFNEYRHDLVPDTFTVNLIINGEPVQISQKQSEALLRQSLEIRHDQTAKIIKLLETQCHCEEHEEFCWAAKAIDLIDRTVNE